MSFPFRVFSFVYLYTFLYFLLFACINFDVSFYRYLQTYHLMSLSSTSIAIMCVIPVRIKSSQKHCRGGYDGMLTFALRVSANNLVCPWDIFLLFQFLSNVASPLFSYFPQISLVSFSLTYNYLSPNSSNIPWYFLFIFSC